jgi:hypothetical protein
LLLMIHRALWTGSPVRRSGISPVEAHRARRAVGRRGASTGAGGLDEGWSLLVGSWAGVGGRTWGGDVGGKIGALRPYIEVLLV